MKLQPIFMLAISINLLIAGFTDPCEKVTCENDGVCIDGIYICIGAYTSADCTFSPPEIEWERSYGGEYHDYARSIQQTTDGGYIIAGGESDLEIEFGGLENFIILKIDNRG